MGNVRSPVEQEIESVNALSFVSISPRGLARVQQSTEADGEMILLKTFRTCRASVAAHHSSSLRIFQIFLLLISWFKFFLTHSKRLL